MQVILLETIDSLGIAGSEVKVADGYGRNYLLPRKKALLATPQNKKLMESQKAKIALKIEKEKGLANEMAKRLEAVVITVPVKITEDNRLYGSVNAIDIKAALEAMGIEVERRMILLSEPIKAVGSFKVPVKVYSGIEPEITIEVIAE
ncbi:50S ribosomal protein L9 [Desulforegula conservatrix]|uniref:50S ribosomal protein L9 n=1 Tax=Desulforegula conservatrix TaxID=153026 RepID=UPI00040AA34D|nr:50S ribosomal protein L9 [Desulforegula conservatrix]